jgi:hypothetical protein
MSMRNRLLPLWFSSRFRSHFVYKASERHKFFGPSQLVTRCHAQHRVLTKSASLQSLDRRRAVNMADLAGDSPIRDSPAYLLTGMEDERTPLLHASNNTQTSTSALQHRMPPKKRPWWLKLVNPRLTKRPWRLLEILDFRSYVLN